MGSKVKLAVAVAVVLFIAFTLLVSLPMLFYDIVVAQRPCTRPTALRLEAPTLFVGDLHIRSSSETERFLPLREFIVNSKVVNLVILGDLFDSPGVYAGLSYEFGGPEAAQLRLADVLNLRGLTLAVFLVLGSPSHDPQSLSFDIKSGGISFRTVGKCVLVEVDKLKTLALHGDEAFLGPAGFAFSWFFGPLTLEREWKSRTGVDASTWVVMAHTHWPGLDVNGRVGNTGGWLDIPLFDPPTGMGILVEGSELMLVQIAG